MMSDILLKVAAALQVHTSAAKDRMRDQVGAEVVQVIMIMGIVAVLIVLILAPGSPINDEIRTLANTVKSKLSIAGS